MPPSHSLETREVGGNNSSHQLVEDALLQLPVASVDKHVVYPLHQAITLSEIVLFFVETLLVIDVAVVAVTDDQRFQIGRQVSAEAVSVRPPHSVDRTQQS